MAPGSPSGQQDQAAAELPLGLLEPDTKGCLGHLVLGNSVKGSRLFPTFCPLTSPCSSSPLPPGEPKSVVVCAKYVAAILSFFFLLSQYWGWTPELWVDILTVTLP